MPSFQAGLTLKNLCDDLWARKSIQSYTLVELFWRGLEETYKADQIVVSSNLCEVGQQQGTFKVSALIQVLQTYCTNPTCVTTLLNVEGEPIVLSRVWVREAWVERLVTHARDMVQEVAKLTYTANDSVALNTAVGAHPQSVLVGYAESINTTEHTHQRMLRSKQQSQQEQLHQLDKIRQENKQLATSLAASERNNQYLMDQVQHMQTEVNRMKHECREVKKEAEKTIKANQTEHSAVMAKLNPLLDSLYWATGKDKAQVAQGLGLQKEDKRVITTTYKIIATLCYEQGLSLNHVYADADVILTMADLIGIEKMPSRQTIGDHLKQVKVYFPAI